jgi:hypothetical protein
MSENNGKSGKDGEFEAQSEDSLISENGSLLSELQNRLGYGIEVFDGDKHVKIDLSKRTYDELKSLKNNSDKYLVNERGRNKIDRTIAEFDGLKEKPLEGLSMVEMRGILNQKTGGRLDYKFYIRGSNSELLDLHKMPAGELRSFNKYPHRVGADEKHTMRLAKLQLDGLDRALGNNLTLKEMRDLKTLDGQKLEEQQKQKSLNPAKVVPVKSLSFASAKPAPMHFLKAHIRSKEQGRERE